MSMCRQDKHRRMSCCSQSGTLAASSPTTARSLCPSLQFVERNVMLSLLCTSGNTQIIDSNNRNYSNSGRYTSLTTLQTIALEGGKVSVRPFTTVNIVITLQTSVPADTLEIVFQQV